MPLRRPFAALALLVLAILACGLPAGPSASTSAPPAASPTGAAASPTGEPEIETVSMLEALTTGVEPRSADEAQRVIRGLSYMIGELAPEEAFGDAPLLNGEGTGVLRLAQIRLEESAYQDPEREEIERLLAVLLPPRETLESISSSAAALVRGAGVAAPAERPPAEPCRDLWASGFTLPFAQCLEFLSFSVGDRTYRVYYPSYWPEGHAGRTLLDPAFEALRESVRLYNTYGPEPVMSTDVVLMDLDLLVTNRATGETSRDPSVFAAALFPSGDSAPDPASASCRVGVFPSAMDDPDTLRQSLAHELFHCYQYTDLRFQEYASRQARSQWWVEGSAEFFGSVVYPDLDDEFQYLPSFRTRAHRRSLLALDYDAYPFFLYLARQAGLGPEGVIGLLRQMPERSGGVEAEQQVLAGVAGIEEAFHQFGRAYLDRQLEDYGGGPLPLEPTEGPLATFGVGTADPPGFFPAGGPFRLRFYRLHFDDHVRFRLEPGIEGMGKVGIRPAGAPGSWGAVPSRLNTACDESNYLLLLTGAVPPGTDPIALTLGSVGERVDEEDGCDECLLGQWTLDNSSYLAHMGAEWPIIQAMLPMFGLDTGGATATPTEVFGVMQMKFTDDGGVSGTQDGWGIAGIVTTSDGALTARIAYHGAGEGTWRIQEDDTGDLRYIVWDNTSFSLIGQMTFDRLPPMAPQNVGGTNDSAFLGTPQRFVCQADTLTFGPEDPQGPLLFRRSSEISP